MSGGEPSSIKQFAWCAAGEPALSGMYAYRVGVMFDFVVCGLLYSVSFFMLFSFPCAHGRARAGIRGALEWSV